MNKSTFFGAVAVIFIIFAGFFIYRSVNPVNQLDTQNLSNINPLSSQLRESLRENKPESLQSAFLSDVKNGKNDENTKSAIYFINHRYFDNGGDIYEIYNYVNSHPELSFLNDAEKIYPVIFDKIKNKELKKNDIESMFALLAYMEIVVKNGYGDIATVATIANKYAEQADLFTNTLAKGGLSTEATLQYKGIVKNSLTRSTKYASMAEKEVQSIIVSGDSDGVAKQDIVVGMNQFAHTLALYKKLGVKYSGALDYNTVFDFSEKYSYSNARDFYVFTNYLHITSMINAGDATKEETEKYLKVLTDSIDSTKVDLTKYSVGQAILTSKDDKTKIGDASFDKVIKLAGEHPFFKTWLINSGKWTESDFK